MPAGPKAPQWANAAPPRASSGRGRRGGSRAPGRQKRVLTLTQKIVRGCVWGGTAFLFLLTVADLFAASAWIADLVTYGRVAVAVLAVVMLGSSAATRLFLTAGVCALLLIANVYLTLRPSWEIEAAPLPHMGAVMVTVATFDTVSDGSLPGFRQWVGDKDKRPDIVGLQNLTNPWRTAVAQMSDIYPYHASVLHGELVKEELVSRFPITSAQIFRPAGQRTAVLATVDIFGAPTKFLVMAPNKASSPARWSERNQYFGLVAQWLQAQSHGGDRTVVLGDWNVTPWSPAYRSFLDQAGLRPAVTGAIPPMTHHLSLIPFLGLSDDHIAVSPKVAVRRCAAGPDLNSDHLPLVCQIAVQ